MTVGLYWTFRCGLTVVSQSGHEKQASHVSRTEAQGTGPTIQLQYVDGKDKTTSERLSTLGEHGNRY